MIQELKKGFIPSILRPVMFRIIIDSNFIKFIITQIIASNVCSSTTQSEIPTSKGEVFLELKSEDAVWQKWKLSHGKIYPSPFDEFASYNIWSENRKKVSFNLREVFLLTNFLERFKIQIL